MTDKKTKSPPEDTSYENSGQALEQDIADLYGIPRSDKPAEEEPQPPEES